MDRNVVARRWLVIAWVLVLAAAACDGGAPETGGPAPSPSPSLVLPFAAPEGVNPEILAPLLGLGGCPAAPDALASAEPTELGLPEETLLTQVEEQDPLTQIQGWIDWTPVQLRVWYQHLSGFEIVQAEDEVFESEILLRPGGGRRLYVKAQAVCESASVFVAILAPEEAAGSVPTPAGSPAPVRSPG